MNILAPLERLYKMISKADIEQIVERKAVLTAQPYLPSSSAYVHRET